MNSIITLASAGEPSCNVVTTRPAELTGHMEHEAFECTQISTRKWTSSITCALCRTLRFCWKLIESIPAETMPRAIYGSRPARNSAGIPEPPYSSFIRASDGRRENGQSFIAAFLRKPLLALHNAALAVKKFCYGRTGQIRVYDLVDAGARHRFSTANFIVHNCLGLGYGCGPEKFRAIAKTMCGLEIGEREARETVAAFRASNRRITELWNRLQTDCRRSVGGNYEVELPSGRKLTYFNVSSRGGWTFQTERGGSVQRFYGGRIAENLTQATARDVFADGLLRVERAGFQILFHCHDEVVCEVPAESATEAAAEISRLMTTTPDWMPGIPLEAETQVSDRYCK